MQYNIYLIREQKRIRTRTNIAEFSAKLAVFLKIRENMRFQFSIQWVYDFQFHNFVFG